MTLLTRRALIGTGAAAGGLLLAGCDRIASNATVRAALASTERLTYRAQRLVVDRAALAPEFSGADLSPVFRSNGTRQPAGADYAAQAATGFRDWRLEVTGLVARPRAYSLADLGRLPARTQITRHDCVEGWSAIGRWTGTPLRLILNAVGLLPAARYVVFHCADRIGASTYYESIDLIDAFHPQTILAWALNGAMLPIANGAPLRLRVERQLGYKHAKYLTGIEAVASLDRIGRGKGGYWEDSNDYDWYAGI
jgi:DMSO/TMAO reductase YedYZ molybdopterin-dependent catalytic subunit